MIASTSGDPAIATVRPADRRRRDHRIAFATPGALDGGGIGRMTGYIVDEFASGGGPLTIVLDTRGSGHVLWSPLFLAWTLARLAVLILGRRVAVVHINVSERASFPRKALVQAVADAFGCPTVVHLHGASFVEYFESGATARLLTRWLFQRCGRLVVLGGSWRDYVVDHVGVDPDKVRVLYNAVPDLAASGREPPPVTLPMAWPAPSPAILPVTGGSRPISLLVLANLCERKGIGCLLRACRRLAEAGFPFRVTLGGGGEVEAYRQRAADLGLADHCRFLGWVSREDAHALTATHDLLLLPSTHEGLPMAILEALCARLPVITTPVGSIPEVLEDGQTALFIPVDDDEALAQAVITLAGDRGLYRRLVERGRQLFQRRFHIKGYCERLSAVYAELGASTWTSPRPCPRPQSSATGRKGLANGARHAQEERT